MWETKLMREELEHVLKGVSGSGFGIPVILCDSG